MSEELVEQEIAREQAFVDRVYLQLEKSAKSAQALAKEGHARGGLGHEGGYRSIDFYTDQQAVHITLGSVHTPKFGA